MSASTARMPYSTAGYSHHTHLTTARMTSLNRPGSDALRPMSAATYIDSTSDYEEIQKRKPLSGWTRRDHRFMESTLEEDDDLETTSDAESIESLSSRAKMMNEMLSDSDSSFEGRSRTSTDGERTFTSISSYDEVSAPSTPAPEYTSMGFPMVSDEKNANLFRSVSLQDSTLAKRFEQTMSTIGPKGPHLFRSYSSSHNSTIPHITIPHLSIVMPPTPSASASEGSPVFSPVSQRQQLPPSPRSSQPDLSPSESHHEPEVRPMSELSAVVSDYDLEEVRSWSPKQVCAWMNALGFEKELIDKFEKNDISGSILVDLKWEDLKELDIQSFGKRIELWSEIHHLRARTTESPQVLPEPFARIPATTNRISRQFSVRSKKSPQLHGVQMVVREVGHMRSDSAGGVKALPDLPTLLPRSERVPENREVISEDESSEEETFRRVRPQLRKRVGRTRVRVQKRHTFVESEAAGDSDASYKQLRYMPSIDDVDEHVVIRARRIGKSPAARRRKNKEEGIVPNDSVSARGGARRCKKHGEHSTGSTRGAAGEGQRKKKPHRCSKGERCPKYGKMSVSRRKRSRSPEHGTILIATTPSIVDASGAPRISALMMSGSESATRRQSNAPSVLASSDVLGPIQGSDIRLRENNLKEISRMDPLENVKQFLTLQHLQHLEEERESPPPVPTKSAEDLARAMRGTMQLPPTPTPSPPMLPRSEPPSSHGSRSFTRLPSSAMPSPCPPPTPSSIPSRSKTPSLGLRTQGMERTIAPELNQSPITRMRSPPTMMRTTTPFSEADVPCPTGTPFNMRSQSQSVPPDMHYRRFPSPSLQPVPSRRGTQSSLSNRPQPLHMSALDENAEWEAIEEEEAQMAPSPHTRTHSGWMKKRRTNWLRHEWPDYHFVLKGTRLGYAKNIAAGEEAGFIEMDNYSVACSNSASNKLSAAFKGAKIFGKKKGNEVHGTYFFQLVPAVEKAKSRSNVGKVHYFAVGSREERIDWMRELMLAKAIKQKKQGFEVEVNGERI